MRVVWGHLRDAHSLASTTRAGRAADDCASAAMPPAYVVLTNDDGPHDTAHSPFVGPFAPHLADWIGAEKLLVCLPQQQQSWRGKAHVPQELLRVVQPPAGTISAE